MDFLFGLLKFILLFYGIDQDVFINVYKDYVNGFVVGRSVSVFYNVYRYVGG